MSRLWFGNPDWWLWLVVVVVVTGAAVVLARAAGRRRLARLLGPGSDTRLQGGLGDLALWAALVALALALLGPRIGRESVWVSATGADVVLLFDVSRSMDARDVPPSRIDRARRTAVSILGRLGPESRAALAAFSGRGVLLTPLTPDTAALVEMVPGLDSELVRPGGSDLERGVLAALGAFDAESQRPRVLVVLSDGEDSVEPASVGQVEVRRRDVRVVGVALGSPRGATIPDHGVPLRDGSGEIVVTRRMERSLERLAEASSGRLFVADEWGEIDVEAALTEIERDARHGANEGEFLERRLIVPVVLPFAAAAFALLWLESLPFAPRWSGLLQILGRRRPAVAAAALAAGLLVLAPPTTRGDDEAGEALTRIAAFEELARHRPLSPTQLIELGLARAEAGRAEAAEYAFSAAAIAARNPATSAIAFHDLGVLALERGDLDMARDRFFDALERNPAQQRSRFNLEWTLFALDREEPPAPSPSPSPTADSEEEQRPDEREAPPEPTIGEEASPGEELPKPGEEPTAGPQPREMLDDAQRERWMTRVSDDPNAALRSAAGEGRGVDKRRGGPAW